ncbi:haloacid dehalogenase [Frateuria sp. Soil773]|uniref:HAD family hydrolase n=1 Tax=Frateuria sp. Soil773 TaxID=1736407 RepID=UPI0006F93612|nr:HAD family hydrolase [Frateuria sp. Soil773]KRE89884.1 haloacid dehalogenase [Frateuria sp. Soil773]
MQTGAGVAASATEAAAPRTVLFDFDGVLIHGDSFAMFVRDRYARSFPRKALALLCAPWLLLVLPFSRRRVLRALVHLALLGVNEASYRAQAQAFAAALVRRPRQFCRDGLQALRRHQAAGDRVIVVTGCEDALVRGILAELGLGGIEVHASRLRGGWLGMRQQWHNVGRRKVQSLAQHGIEAWQVAYGDSMYDVAMLKGAAEAVLVNGSPKLCKRVEKALGRAAIRVEWY